jgi:hypothetical protein
MGDITTNQGPVEVWLTKKNIAVTCRVVFEDETDWEPDVDSLSMRGAQREMTAWFISQDYEPTGRWADETGDEYFGTDEGETVRTFRRKKA